MNTIGVPSRITAIIAVGSRYLTVSRRDLMKFQKTIGFNHPEKKLLLDKILNGSNWNGIPILAL